MTYFEHVQIAGLALKRGEEANWELARLTYENTVDGGGRPANGEMDMDGWCRDVREVAGRAFSTMTGRRYRMMWERHGLTCSDGNKLPSWSETYRALRDEEGVRPDQFDRWAADNVVNRGSVETKVQTVQRLLEDPVVRADKRAQTAALELGVTVYRQREQDVRDHWRADERSERQEAKLEEIGTALEIERICDEIRTRLVRIRPLLEKDRPAAAPFIGLRAVLRLTREECDRIEHWLEHGEDDVDAFARSVLRGQ